MYFKVLSERQRSRLSGCVLIIGLSVLPMSLSLIATTVYIRFIVDDELELVQGMNTATLPYFLAATGFINFLCNLLLLSCLARTYRPSSRKGALPMLLVAIFLTLLASILVLAACIFCFVQISMLPGEFAAGLSDAIDKYSTVPDVKARLDILQIEYECCGDRGYSDWFTTPWISTGFLVSDPRETQLQTESEDEYQYLNDDVPFSCCDPGARRPCIHHHVHTDYLHYLYNHRDNHTLHSAGCRDALMDYFGHTLLLSVALTLLFMFLVQMCIVFSTRVAHSSMTDAAQRGDVKGMGVGYVLNKPKDVQVRKDRQSSQSLLDDDDDDDDDEDYDEISTEGDYDEVDTVSDSPKGRGLYGSSGARHTYSEEPLYQNQEPLYENYITRDVYEEPQYDDLSYPDQVAGRRPSNNASRPPMFPSEMVEEDNPPPGAPVNRRGSKAFDSLGISMSRPPPLPRYPPPSHGGRRNH